MHSGLGYSSVVERLYLTFAKPWSQSPSLQKKKRKQTIGCVLCSCCSTVSNVSISYCGCFFSATSLLIFCFFVLSFTVGGVLKSQFITGFVIFLSFTCFCLMWSDALSGGVCIQDCHVFLENQLLHHYLIPLFFIILLEV